MTTLESEIIKLKTEIHACKITAKIQHSVIDESERRIKELEAKANAYDRIMSGGIRTPKEMANILGKPIAQDKTGTWYRYRSIPHVLGSVWNACDGKTIEKIDFIIDFDGDWTTSLTLPDGWLRDTL